MAVEDDIIKLRGRIAALELATICQTLVKGATEPGFNPIEFATQRAAMWRKIGTALNDDGEPISVAVEEALGNLGDLLVLLAKPIDEELRKQQSGNAAS